MLGALNATFLFGQGAGTNGISVVFLHNFQDLLGAPKTQPASEEGEDANQSAMSRVLVCPGRFGGDPTNNDTTRDEEGEKGQEMG